MIAELLSRMRGDKQPQGMGNPEAGPVQWRHEWKYELTASQAVSIRSRIQAVAERDPHAGPSGRYQIRSLYFDNFRNEAVWQNLDGLNPREKFRIRYYNGDLSFIRLEKKYKRNNLCAKFEEEISVAEVERILSDRMEFFPFESGMEAGKQNTESGRDSADNPLLLELYSKIRFMNLVPKVIVEYTREPYCFDAGNVRVTFDYGIRTGLDPNEFLNTSYTPIPAARPPRLSRICMDWKRQGGGSWMSGVISAGDGLPADYLGTLDTDSGLLSVDTGPILMEVKWDHLLPNIIQDAIQTPGLTSQAFSKYVQCRAFG